MATVHAVGERAPLVRRGRALSWLTLVCVTIEAVVSIGAGVSAGSIALMGFGVDSIIELAASATAIWLLNADAYEADRERAELRALRIIGALFVALTIYVAWGAARMLLTRQRPEESLAGVLVAAASLIVMPLLARAKRKVAVGLGSRALQSEAQQTQLCTYLSAILLGGLILNGAFGWWWADPVAALLMVPIIAKEGFDALRGRHACDNC